MGSWKPSRLAMSMLLKLALLVWLDQFGQWYVNESEREREREREKEGGGGGVVDKLTCNWKVGRRENKEWEIFVSFYMQNPLI